MWPQDASKTTLETTLEQLDIEFRKLVRRMVGPRAGTDWCASWQEVEHVWNARAAGRSANVGIFTWAGMRDTSFGTGRIYDRTSLQRWAERILSKNLSSGEHARCGKLGATPPYIAHTNQTPLSVSETWQRAKFGALPKVVHRLCN